MGMDTYLCLTQEMFIWAETFLFHIKTVAQPASIRMVEDLRIQDLAKIQQVTPKPFTVFRENLRGCLGRFAEAVLLKWIT